LRLGRLLRWLSLGELRLIHATILRDQNSQAAVIDGKPVDDPVLIPSRQSALHALN
jgi:hypothetical protein